MKFRMFLFGLTVGLLSITASFAVCIGYASQQSGYSSTGNTFGETANCSSYSKKYYHNSDTMEYDTMISCSACSGTNVVLTTVSGGSNGCSFEYSFCTPCTNSASEPSWGNSAGGPPAPTGCSTTSTIYVGSEYYGTYYEVTSCASCPSGYFLEYISEKMGVCGYSRTVCVRCGPGSYRINNSCKSCSVGTYSSTYNASSCTTCPNATDYYTNSGLTTSPSVSGGQLTSPTGATLDDCYAKSGTYYDSAGTWRYDGTCAYDGTATADKCATIQTACLNTTQGLTAQVVKTGSVPTGTAGAACFCATNGKYFYYTTMGASPIASSSGCESSCLSACTSVITASTTLRADLGCD